MDILSALNATPKPSGSSCKLTAFLDTIPDDAPGKADLLSALGDPAGWAATRLTLTFSALGHPISSDTINNHRAKRCKCYR